MRERERGGGRRGGDEYGDEYVANTYRTLPIRYLGANLRLRMLYDYCILQ